MKRLILISIFLGAFAVYFVGGFYNVSALKSHNSILESFTHITKHRSIKNHSKYIAPPLTTVDKKLLKQGFDVYDSKCAQCHGGPGISDSEFVKGLYPKPPRFPRDLEYDEIGDKEIFWTTKNGIKMSGMPAYSHTLDDDEIWAVVNFILKLPELNEEEYKDYKRTLILNFSYNNN